MTIAPSRPTAAPSGHSGVARRLVIVVRADPVICGHAGEARNLAEVALTRGFDDVRIVTWPLDQLERSGLPLKPMSTVLPYSPGITVERPDGIGDYKVPDARYSSGMAGRLVELFTDGVPTVCLSLYLLPHASVVQEAVRTARSTGLPVDVTTMAEAVGSDITNVVRSSLTDGNYGAAASLFSNYLDHDRCLAVSEFTKELIIESAVALDSACGTSFADRCRSAIDVSYPAINPSLFTEVSPASVTAVLEQRGLTESGYVLFLSRLTPAKGVDDLIAGYAASAAAQRVKLVIAGNGPAERELRDLAASTPVSERILFLNDVGDEEKARLMRGCAAYVLPSKPRPEFVETFGIALVENALSGGGPVITTTTGGIPEAVGPTAMNVPVSDPAAIAHALDQVIVDMSASDRAAHVHRARAYALQFDRENVFDRMMDGLGLRT